MLLWNYSNIWQNSGKLSWISNLKLISNETLFYLPNSRVVYISTVTSGFFLVKSNYVRNMYVYNKKNGTSLLHIFTKFRMFWVTDTYRSLIESRHWGFLLFCSFVNYHHLWLNVSSTPAKDDNLCVVCILSYKHRRAESTTTCYRFRWPCMLVFSYRSCFILYKKYQNWKKLQKMSNLKMWILSERRVTRSLRPFSFEARPYFSWGFTTSQRCTQESNHRIKLDHLS